MESLIPSALRAVRSLFTPGMFVVFLLSVALTVAALAGFVMCSSAFFIWLGEHLHNGLAGYVPWLGSIGSALLAWFLFPGIMPVIVSFFDDRIARIIEREEYPAVASAHEPAFWPEFWHDVRFSLAAILLNILVLPLYLLPVFNLFLFYLLNGYLLGREFFVMAARRHMPAQQAEILRKRYSRPVMLAGIALALLATVPVLNLFAPFWGIAVMVHLFHKLSPSFPPQLQSFRQPQILL